MYVCLFVCLFVGFVGFVGFLVCWVCLFVCLFVCSFVCVLIIFVRTSWCLFLLWSFLISGMVFQDHFALFQNEHSSLAPRIRYGFNSEQAQRLFSRDNTTAEELQNFSLGLQWCSVPWRWVGLWDGARYKACQMSSGCYTPYWVIFARDFISNLNLNK